MKIFERYKEILNECFPKPPKNVPDICMKIINQYPVDIVSISKNNIIIGCCMVVKIHEGFYGISWVVVDPSYQRQGIGKKMMNIVHEKYQGIFITKTRDAEVFYQKLGYITVFHDNNHAILAFVNDKNKINF